MFRVNMFWGRSNKNVVYGLNDDGELVPQKVMEDGPPDPDYRFLSCGGNSWFALLEMGRQHGWEPSGTVPGEELKEGESFNDSYEPYGYYEFYKKVTENDAKNWADALNKAIQKIERGELEIGEIKEPNIISPAMTKEQYEKRVEKLNTDFIEEFIAFLRKGPFLFSWDD